LFLTWNKATFNSFYKQIKSTGDPENRYKNELSAFKEYIAISSDNEINKNSIRYEFLKELQENMSDLDFYIIESNRSGEEVEIRNYVVYFKGDLVKEAFIYRYLKGKWVKNKLNEINLKINPDLSVKRYGEGSNEGNVIITRFIKYKVDVSDFFLYTTLFKESTFFKILMLK